MPLNVPIHWRAYEHHHTDHGSDWFWALGIVAVSSALTALIFSNILFAILIVVAALTLGLLAARPPQPVEFEIGERGVKTGTLFHPYDTMYAFWIDEEHEDGPVLLIDTPRAMAPDLIIPLPETLSPEAVRAFLLEKEVEERELHEAIFHRILEFFGF